MARTKSKKSGGRVVTDRLPIFRTYFVFAAMSSTEEDVSKATDLDVDQVDWPDTTCLAQCQKIERHNGAIGILLHLPDKYNESTLIHECLHAAHMVLDHVGVPCSPDEDEAMAYLLEYIVKMAKDKFYGMKVDYFS